MNILNDKLNIKLTGEEKILNLEKKEIGNNELDLLCIIQFKKLEELILRNNNISDISPLINLNSPKLRKIDLSINKIMNINAFEYISKMHK